MNQSCRVFSGFSLLALALCASGARADEPAFDHEVRLESFYRGNTHTHTDWSDGDAHPNDVIKRYKDLGYNFVVITDHNRADTVPQAANQNDDSFIAIPGEEVTYTGVQRHRPGLGNVSVHVNSICQYRGDGAPVPSQWFSDVGQALQHAVDFATAHPGAIAQINHPNYQWALTYDDLKDIHGAALMEVANQHQIANNAGDATHPSVEQLWDRLLSSGHDIYGTASDDMHALNQGHGEKWARPGHGWVQVAADSLSGESIASALASGRFYSSTGVRLSRVEAAGRFMNIEIDPGSHPASAYRTVFIGKNGRVLGVVTGLHPSYSLQGNEGYVRAVVHGPDGKEAWVQPVRVRDPQ